MSVLLSVIVPVYNTKLFLSECIESILHQDYENIEIIIVDDGSNDGSEVICESYKEKDERIRVIHKRNNGTGSARNVGTENATGTLITFVDSDDYVRSDTYISNIKYFERNDKIDIVQFPFCRINNKKIISEHGIKDSYIIYKDCEKFIEAYRTKRINSYMCNKIFKKDIFNSLRFKEEIYFEDRILLSYILERSNGFLFSNTGMYYYTQRDGQITSLVENEKFIFSQIMSNLSIMEFLLQYKEFYDVALQKYSECIYWAKKSKDNYLKDILEKCPPLMSSLFSNAKLGHKKQVLFSKILQMKLR